MHERLLYKSRCLQAIQYPSEYMSIILDGMNAAHIPLSMPIPKCIFHFSPGRPHTPFFSYFSIF